MIAVHEVFEFLRQFNYVTILIRLTLALIAGGIIGTERGKHGSAAGLRTHILVCIGSAMTALTGYYVYDILNIEGDVLRLAAQVISGIGFLGAGMIIVKNNNIITGLTTAAGMWATATIGIAFGYGFYSGAIIATLFCIFTATFLTILERKRKKSLHIFIEFDVAKNIENVLKFIHTELDENALIEVIPPKSNVPNSIGVSVTFSSFNAADDSVQKINEVEGVRFFICQ